jgi:hypothetical protein
VRIQDLRQAKDRRPFEPFGIHLADGREIAVSHPDALAWSDEDAPELLAALPGGAWEAIDVAAIVSLCIRAPEGRSTP